MAIIFDIITKFTDWAKFSSMPEILNKSRKEMNTFEKALSRVNDLFKAGSDAVEDLTQDFLHLGIVQKAIKFANMGNLVSTLRDATARTQILTVAQATLWKVANAGAALFNVFTAGSLLILGTLVATVVTGWQLIKKAFEFNLGNIGLIASKVFGHLQLTIGRLTTQLFQLVQRLRPIFEPIFSTLGQGFIDIIDKIGNFYSAILEPGGRVEKFYTSLAPLIQSLGELFLFVTSAVVDLGIGLFKIADSLFFFETLTILIKGLVIVFNTLVNIIKLPAIMIQNVIDGLNDLIDRAKSLPLIGRLLGGTEEDRKKPFLRKPQGEFDPVDGVYRNTKQQTTSNNNVQNNINVVTSGNIDPNSAPQTADMIALHIQGQAGR